METLPLLQSSKDEENHLEDGGSLVVCGSFKRLHRRRSMRIADVVFIVGKNEQKQRFLAHRMMMSMNSPFFLEFFFGECPVKVKEIVFPDVSPIGFKAMLNYFYNENFNIQSLQEAVETFVVAKKFKVCQLEELCQSYLLVDTPLTPESVCVLYDLAIIAEMHNILYDCMKLVDKDTMAVFNSQSFKNASSRVVLDIVKRPLLTIRSEADLMSALIQWARAECKRQGTVDNKENIEKVLSPFMSYVRFHEILPEHARLLDLTISEGLEFTSEEDSITDDNGDPLYSTVGYSRRPALKPRMYSVYYKYKLRLLDPSRCKPLLDSHSFILQVTINKGSAYVCGVSLGLKPLRPDRTTSFQVKMEAKNVNTGHIQKISGQFINTSLLVVLVFNKPLFAKEGQRVCLYTTIFNSKNLLAPCHPECSETVEMEGVNFTVLPMQPAYLAAKGMCVFKEIMVYF